MDPSSPEITKMVIRKFKYAETAALALFAYFITCAFALLAVAAEPPKANKAESPSNFGISGYVSETAMQTSEFVYEAGSPDGGLLTEAGINMSYDINTPVSLLVGFNYKNTRSEDKVILEYGFADAQVYKSLDSTAGLRFGRVKVAAGFYNEARSNPRARPTIMLPQPVYFGVFSDIADIADGMQGYYTKSYANGLMLNILATSGTLHANNTQKKDLIQLFYATPATGSLDFKKSYSASVQTEYRNLSLSAMTAGIKLSYHAKDMMSVMSEPIPYLDHDIQYQYSSFGIKYALTSELILTREQIRVKLVKKLGEVLPFGDLHKTVDGYYNMVQWNFLPKHRLTYVHGVATSVSDMSPILAMVGVNYADFSTIKHDIFNYTWKATPRCTVKVEQDRMQGTTTLAPSRNGEFNLMKPSAKWDMYSIAVMYEF